VLALLPDEPSWDVPDRLVGAVEYLLLAGEVGTADGWDAFRSVVAEHAAWIETFVREQPVQTNEVQRSWALLPLFLTVARVAQRPLDLLELGTSAGLNLLWDHYRYEYDAGTWGPEESEVMLTGEERVAIPPGLLAADVEIRSRQGIDLRPLDVTREDDLRLLLCFRPPGKARERLLRASAVARVHQPEMIMGDYLDLLPALLGARNHDALTVVFQTISTIYLPLERRQRLGEMIDAAGNDGPLAWISTPTPDEHGLRGKHYPLELAIWPGGERRLVGQMGNAGEWLEWWQ
jgi:hypothetical protein